MIKLFLGNADLNKDLVLYFPTSGFGYYGTCVYGICSKKDDGIWERPDLGSCPPGNLGLLLFSSQTLQQSIYLTEKLHGLDRFPPFPAVVPIPKP